MEEFKEAADILTEEAKKEWSGGGSMGKVSIPIFDPLGILERATRNAPVTLYDPVGSAIRDALRGEHSDSDTMFFNVPEAREHLISKGWVYTLRRERKTGRDTAFYGTLFKKERISRVWVEFVKKLKDMTELEPYLYGSGFDKVEKWWSARAEGADFLYYVRSID